MAKGEYSKKEVSMTLYGFHCPGAVQLVFVCMEQMGYDRFTLVFLYVGDSPELSYV